MNRSILLTGGTGFVGRQILKSLLNRNVDVTLVVRSETERFESCSKKVKTIPTDNIFKESTCWFERACKGIDTIIHAAWFAKHGEYLNSPINLDCLISTLKFAKVAANSGIKKFVGIGTCLEYDTNYELLSLDTPLLPKSPYAAAKAAAYMMLQQYFGEMKSTDFAWCRLFYMYGEHEDQRRLVPYLRNCLENGIPAELSDGNQIRDYMDVSDVGFKIAKVAVEAFYGPMNICSGMPRTIRDLAFEIADNYGRRDLLRFSTRTKLTNDPLRVVGEPSI